MRVTHNAHPGEILKAEFLKAVALSQNQLARAIAVLASRIHAVVNGTRGIIANTDLRLCKFFGLSKGCFRRLQNTFDTQEANDTQEAKRRIATEVAQIKPFKVIAT